MIEAVDIVIPSLGNIPVLTKCLESLKYIPWPYTLYFIYGVKPACKAINQGFSQTTRDVILMDDDARVLPETFKDFERYYPHADIFGFRLSTPEGILHHGGINITKDGVGHKTIRDEYKVPTYVPLVTAALCFIKRRVLDKQRFPDNYPGIQFEDVDFGFRATDNGFKTLYIPNNGIHGGSSTSRSVEGFKVKEYNNFMELKKRFDFNKYKWSKDFNE